MAKHTLREILGIFALGAGHTHEKAVSDVYDAGFDAGKAHQTAEFQAGLGSDPAPAPAAQGSTDETEKAAEGESTEDQSAEADAPRRKGKQA